MGAGRSRALSNARARVARPAAAAAAADALDHAAPGGRGLWRAAAACFPARARVVRPAAAAAAADALTQLRRLWPPARSRCMLSGASAVSGARFGARAGACALRLLALRAVKNRPPRTRKTYVPAHIV